MVKESTFQAKLKKFFSDSGGYVVKFNASGISKVGVPDLLVCLNGNFVGVEVKKEDGRISDIQQWNIEEIRKSGGYAFCIKPSDFEEMKKNINDLHKVEEICKHNEKVNDG